MSLPIEFRVEEAILMLDYVLTGSIPIDIKELRALIPMTAQETQEVKTWLRSKYAQYRFEVRLLTPIYFSGMLKDLLRKSTGDPDYPLFTWSKDWRRPVTRLQFQVRVNSIPFKDSTYGLWGSVNRIRNFMDVKFMRHVATVLWREFCYE